MQPAEDPAATAPHAAWRLRQTVLDTWQRSRYAGFLYVFGWVVVVWLAQVHRIAPWVGAVAALGFLAAGGWRLRLRPPADAGDSAAHRRWLAHYAVAMTAAPALWSVLQAWIVLDARFGLVAVVVAMLGTIGYATVIANVYTTMPRAAAAGVGVLMLPMLATLWAQPDRRALAVAASLYGTYLVGALLRTRREYQRRLDLDQALHEQRDLYAHLARTDPLTGLYNRRHFSDRLEALASAARAGGGGFSLLILDIDHFKRINDRHGHAVGDACLKAMADRLQRSFPSPASLLARLGGEEFGVLVEGDPTVAAAVAEAFRQGLVAQPLSGDSRPMPLTVSIGVGAFDPQRHEDGDGLYRAVDLALYAAKSQGRNRVQAATVGA